MTNEQQHTDIKTFGESFQMPLKPAQKIQIGINGVIPKEFTVENYATLRIKWWLALDKKQ